MFALMEMTNPMWEWLIAPLLLFSLGMAVGWFMGMYEKRAIRRARSYRSYLEMLAAASRKGDDIYDV